MRQMRWIGIALLLMLGMPGYAGAQEETIVVFRRPSVFDFAVYGGAGVTSRWYEGRTFRVEGPAGSSESRLTQVGRGEPYKIGGAPTFGAHVTYWPLGGIGLRLNYTYMPSAPPEFSRGFFDLLRLGDEYPLNNHFYDLDIVLRFANLRFLSRAGANLYGFIGAGGLTTDLAGGNADGCEPDAFSRGACLPFSRGYATVGQWTVGVGGSVLPLRNNLGVFTEIGLHGYDSPVHDFEPLTGGPDDPPTGATVRGANDQFALTARVVVGLKLLVGGAIRRIPAPPFPTQTELPPPDTPIRACILENGALREVDARVRAARGDTVVVVEGEQRPFAAVHPVSTGYAATREFFIQDGPVSFGDRRYIRFGLPQVIAPGELARVGEFQGVPVFTEAGASARPELVYLPVRPGCEFQPYRIESGLRPRG